jgi:DNA-binding response OmpR family regulator
MAQVKRKILIVDDEPDVGQTLKMILEQYGFDVDCFTDPRKVLENFRPDFYALIILDIKMPEVNGFELYHKLKSKDANIKTIFLTALSHVEDYSTPSNKVYPIMGERHFVKKPVDNRDLLEQVYSILVR